MRRFNVLQSLVVLFLFSKIAWGSVPQLINFQGILKDGSGNPVPDNSYTVTLTIYDAPTAGNVKWTETQSVTTSVGLFTVLLGSTTPVPDSAFNDSSRYLGIQVGADPEMTPRQRLASVVYALRVAHFIPKFGLANTFIGENAGNLTMTDGGNTASGAFALENNTTGGSNTATGVDALVYNTDGDNNTASGAIALLSNTTGSNNTASGSGALASNTTGSNNTAIGFQANVSAGNLNNATAIGAGAVVDASNKIRLGNSAVTLVETDGNFKVGVNDTVFSSNFSSNSPLRLQTAGTTRMYIEDVSGNVGIGTSAPAERLTVKGATSNGGGDIASFYNSNNALKSEITDRGEQRWYIQDATNAERGSISYTVPTGVPGIAFLDASGTSRSDFRHVTGGGFALAAGSGSGIPTEWMRLTASGNLGIGTTSPGASNLLELSSTTKGFVLPRMTKAQRDAIATPVAGMAVYQTDNTPGLRVYNGTNWMRFTETAD